MNNLHFYATPLCNSLTYIAALPLVGWMLSSKNSQGTSKISTLLMRYDRLYREKPIY